MIEVLISTAICVHSAEKIGSLSDKADILMYKALAGLSAGVALVYFIQHITS